LNDNKNRPCLKTKRTREYMKPR